MRVSWRFYTELIFLFFHFSLPFYSSHMLSPFLNTSKKLQLLSSILCVLREIQSQNSFQKQLPELCYLLRVIPVCSLYKIPSQPLSGYSLPGAHLLSVWGCRHHCGRYRKHQNQDSPRAGKCTISWGPSAAIGTLRNLMDSSQVINFEIFFVLLNSHFVGFSASQLGIFSELGIQGLPWWAIG